tara:strand:+ start:8711 stop:9481 length:771 start_codon:yes stop_codon:yes gene_type:complete
MAKGPLQNLIQSTKAIVRFSQNNSSLNSSTFKTVMVELGENVRRRMLRGVQNGYDVRGKQFKHLTQFSKLIRERELGGQKTKQFGDLGKDVKMKGYKAGPRSFNVDGFSFAKTTDSILVSTGDLVRAIGSHTKQGKSLSLYSGNYESKVIDVGMTTVTIKDPSGAKGQASNENLHYAKKQNEGFTQRGSKHKFNGVWNTNSKNVPARQWLGIPVTYQTGTGASWRKQQVRFFQYLNESYIRATEGKDPKVYKMKII